MNDPGTGAAAARLAGIKEQHALATDASLGFQRIDDRHQALIHLAYSAIPRLLAALEAVLARHRPGRIMILGALCPEHEACRHFSITGTEAACVVACPDCTATVCDSCAGCGPQVRLDSCPERAAISAALLGEGSGTADA